MASARASGKIQMRRLQRRLVQIERAGQQFRVGRAAIAPCPVRRRASDDKGFGRPTVFPAGKPGSSPPPRGNCRPPGRRRRAPARRASCRSTRPGLCRPGAGGRGGSGRRTFFFRAEPAGRRSGGGKSGSRHAQDILAGQRIGIAVVHEIALLGQAEIARGGLEFLRRQQSGQFRRASSSRTFPPCLRCRRPRRSKSRPRDGSCRAARKRRMSRATSACRASPLTSQASR